MVNVHNCHLSYLHVLPLINEVAAILPFASGKEIPGVFWVFSACRGHVLSTTTNDHLGEKNRQSQTHQSNVIQPE